MQNFKNHTRYYPLHHFIITPLTIIYFIWSLSNVFTSWGTDQLSGELHGLLGAIILLILPLLARIYALKNQDRTIRLEMRQRYFELTGESFLPKEKKLRLSQIIALRFASDNELVVLIEKAISGGMRSKEIKQEIQNWQEDRRRV
ncbi:hypothetical protein A33Q_2469 [Indibacter alkaliphilus LW1]|jgi:hypothetical protein|uniref:Uncharacterized protein n=1 Tax=Indibacter alkaliphilus (strain CCUG 57479 / KCTC 22604 / LW1) TaxID=1189612 RepID=S2E2I7_INDAL|nr:DUF6526 family protein [Indibacter alkaliphilus]EOZ96348.1 hypothetical protein A33Q_2469 [Indibacter alkaliphilus LW1]